MQGQIMTVRGAIPPGALGITLTHEHLLIDLRVWCQEPREEEKKVLARLPVEMSTLGAIRRDPLVNLDNCLLDDQALAISELRQFKAAGGTGVVDCTNNGLGRAPLALRTIAEATGVHIIMGSGYYIGRSHPRDLHERTVDAVAEEIVRDLTAGVGDTGVRAGLIGEIGNTWPWTENEKKVVRAAVEAQRQTGAPLMIHPGRDQTAPMQILELIGKQGGDLKRTIMCHIERTIADERHLLDLAATGVWLEYDLFGMENSYYPYNPDFDMPNDGGRMAQILALIGRGHQDQILMSHDIAYKSSLTKYGGYGYHHLLVNVVPRLRRKGVDDAGLRRLLVENPARAFVFA